MIKTQMMKITKKTMILMTKKVDNQMMNHIRKKRVGGDVNLKSPSSAIM